MFLLIYRHNQETDNRRAQAMQEWCNSEDAVEKFNNIISKSNVYNVSYRPNENKIVIVGPAKETNRATIMLDFIMDHQNELIELAIQNEQMSKSLETKRQKIMKSDSVEEVVVPKDLLGLIIGKGGANISYIKQEYDVGIHIIEHGEEDYKDYTETVITEEEALIRIYGNNPKWVKMAKKEIYLQRIFHPIPADKVDFIKGYQNSIINDMKEKSGCVRLYVQDPESKKAKTSQIEVIGNEEAIENFKILLETHLNYYDTYQSREYENAELNKQYNKINSNYGESYQGGDKDYYNQGYKKRNKNRGH